VELAKGTEITPSEEKVSRRRMREEIAEEDKMQGGGCARLLF